MNNLQEDFSQIYDKYIKKIYRFIFIKVNSQETAEDLCSEVFLRCWQTFNKNPDKIENVQAFLYKIARNLVIDHYREKSKIQVISADNVPVIDPSLESDLEEKTMLDSDIGLIRENLGNLKQNYQDVIIWHYIDDLSIPEIARTIDKSEGTVRVMLHRALKALKREVENREA